MILCLYLWYGVEIQVIPVYPYQLITTEIMWCAIHHRIEFLKVGCKLIRFAPISANTIVMLRILNISTIDSPRGDLWKTGFNT